VKGELTVKWAEKSTFANSAVLLGTMRFGAIVSRRADSGRVHADGRPVLRFEGTVEIGIELKPYLKLSAAPAAL